MHWRGMAAAGVALALAACASSPSAPPAGETQRVTARLASGTVSEGVRYEKDTGTCTGDAVQLVSREEYASLTRGWRSDAGCTSPAKAVMPSATGYPLLEGRRMPGSAHVLVQLQADGEVAGIHAVCATSAEFGAAAEDTVRTLRFRPGQCGGQPVGMAFMLPLDFDPD